MSPKLEDYRSSNVINLADRRVGQNNPPGGPLQPPGGGGTFDGVEARVAKLEAIAEHIQRDLTEVRTDVRTLRDNARTDFRILFGAIISSTLGLAALMAKGFDWF